MTTSSESPGRRGPGECPWRATLLCVESTFREPRDVRPGCGVPGCCLRAFARAVLLPRTVWAGSAVQPQALRRGRLVGDTPRLTG